jgi:zinc protease
MASRNAKVTIIALMFILFYLLPGLQASLVQAMPPVQRSVLPNGMVLLVSQEHSLPLVTLQLLIDAGSRKDPSGQEGLAYLTARGLLLGTSNRTVTTMNEELDFIGASLDVSIDRDYVTFGLRVLKKDVAKGFDIFRDVLTQPTFPEEEIKREVQKTLAAMQSAEADPMEVAEKAFRKALFLNSPYAHPVEGTRESLSQLKRDAVVRFYGAHYHPNGAILAIVGDITSDEITEQLVSGLQNWPRGEDLKELSRITFAQGPKTVEINREITQANIILGHRGVSREDPDYYALTVMNYILGGSGFGSRLMDEIRVRRGLAYSVASFFDPGKFPGPFQVVLETKNVSAREAISLVLQQMERMQREMVSEQELETAKRYLTGSFPLRLDGQAKLASFITQVEYYGLGLDYPDRYPLLISAITREGVLRVAKAYLHPDNYVLVVVANLKEAGMKRSSTQ